ncbi:MAG TPA: polyprenyl synthetase family protein, partial [Bellilinea sp.]|nr:polyprenyl synthetase family protein [Bellilinea sp.]
MQLKDFQGAMQPAIDSELRALVTDFAVQNYTGLTSILAYQLGWEGEGAGLDAQGKRLRPLLVTLAAKASGGQWENALPAAAAVELLHNFSLIHDDIEDASQVRRGRATVWAKWGQALAINAGDAMYALAFEALKRLEQTVNGQAALRAYEILTTTSLKLTGGQHFDISFADAASLPIESYWPMVRGKTASLLQACLQLGAVTANAGPAVINDLGDFGLHLGLAFQIQDDWLGIWGDEAVTGKSKASDLMTGKKTLPILYGLQQSSEFANAWKNRSTEVESTA